MLNKCDKCVSHAPLFHLPLAGNELFLLGRNLTVAVLGVVIPIGMYIFNLSGSEEAARVLLCTILSTF